MNRTTSGRPVVIFGGAGFVGTNLASRLVERGERVRVFDDLSRAGVERNLDWLLGSSQGRSGRVGSQPPIEFVHADIRDAAAVERAVADAGAIFQLAAQVAVTTSVADPRTDFEINLGGTLNVLEAVRRRQGGRTGASGASDESGLPPLIFTSTNKVYGDLGGVTLVEGPRRYTPEAEHDAGLVAEEPDGGGLAEWGVGETQPLSFHSPYGCSKGAADQYVLDYARIYGLPTVVVRMSCIYGPHQYGTEDQGWLAHFAVQAITGAPIVVFGDGKQVRDLLYVDDLVDALLLARDHAGRAPNPGEQPHPVRGRAFNLGGTPARSVSLLEVLDRLETLCGRRLEVEHRDWRPGDQRWYASDVRRFAAATGWSPRTSVDEGLRRLHGWLVRARSDGRFPAGPTARESGPARVEPNLEPSVGLGPRWTGKPGDRAH